MSTFKYAGVSKLNGKIKARFANDQMRVKVLAKNGHTDIDIIELKHPMTKEEAVAFLLQINFDNGNAAVRAAIEAEVEKRTDAPKTEKAPKAKAPAKKAATKSKPSMDAIKAKAKAVKAKAEKPETVVTKAEVDAQLEDAPF